MSIQQAIDANVDAAVERGDLEKALRMRWMSHANDNATLEPDEIVSWIGKLRVAPEDDFRKVEYMGTKIFIKYVWVDDYESREKIRDMLNGMGFYVLRIQDGLEVNAIRSTPDGLVEWFQGLFN